MTVRFTRAGSIKFKREVLLETLIEIIQDWKNYASADKWLDLHVRSSGDDGTHYIAFHFVLDDGEKATSDKFDESLLADLRRKLGFKQNPYRPRGVKGWSISTVAFAA